MGEDKFYIVNEKSLPEIFKKVIEVKENIEKINKYINKHNKDNERNENVEEKSFISDRKCYNGLVLKEVRYERSDLSQTQYGVDQLHQSVLHDSGGTVVERKFFDVSGFIFKFLFPYQSPAVCVAAPRASDRRSQKRSDPPVKGHAGAGGGRNRPSVF